jgi:GTPase Era involved in 16S rRNA processing
MSSEQFQATYDSIHNTGTRLLQYLQEIEEGRRSEGNNSEGLQSIEDELNKALEALQAQKYQVAVIAAMKAGKSTFLNAMIGADILASESEACTVCRTDVRLLEPGQVPRLLEYRQGQRQPIVISEGDTGKIRQDFLERTHQIRENNNSDNTTRFELWHSIEAISKYSSLAGFTLVDTPGPNEWESAGFNTVALKQTALEALRTCNAILFVLDYSSFKDNTNSELLQDLIEQRREFLAENTGKIYFILNKVDRKSERDREIQDVIEDLKKTLIDFGIPKPIIYPVSAWQGLLAKLIQQGTVADSQLKDFKRFFSARYATENEEGDLVTPAPRKIAPQALKDSGMPTVENTVLQTIIQNSGWNLLSDVLAKIDKTAKAIEDTLKTQINGWDMEIETLKQKVEEYRKRSESAKRKVEAVQESLEEQKQTLIRGFSQGMNAFAEAAKTRIGDEIERIAESRISNNSKHKFPKESTDITQAQDDSEIVNIFINLGTSLLELIPVFGNNLAKTFKIVSPLFDVLRKANPRIFNNHEFADDDEFDYYKIRVKTENEDKNIRNTINEFCAPHLQSWWIDTQDQLIRDGNRIREELVQKIQKDIQQISNEMSDYLGETLEVEMNINPIQFPSFEFKGIDAEVKRQQQISQKTTTSHDWSKSKGWSESQEDYLERISYQENIKYYEIDLRKISEEIKTKIDNQTAASQKILERVIKKQVSADFSRAEKQINQYMERCQDVLDRLLRDRETKEAEADQIRSALETQKTQLNEYLSELASIRESLNTWKPM